MKTTATLAAGLVAALLQGAAAMEPESAALSPKDRHLAAVAALAARGALPALSDALDAALADGVAADALREALVQVYAYCGFPRALNALGTLMPKVGGGALPPAPSAAATNGLLGAAALALGTDTQTKLCGGPVKGALFDFSPAIDSYLKAHLFGDVFSGPALTWREREIATVAMLAAREGLEPQLAAHVGIAKRNGVTDAQIAEIRALATTPTVWPIGEPNAGYAQYFIGNSYLAPLDAEHGGPVNVTFEPGCRNNWHVHHKQVQVLVCVAGRGWYQEWGRPAVELRPGTVVAVPAETKHWHGAAKDGWMQHLTYHTHVEEGASNEWLEPVDDEAYAAAAG